MSNEVTVYTTSQVAALAFVDNSTVRLWVKKGQLKPQSVTPGGHYRFDRDTVHNLLQITPVDSASPSAESAGVLSSERRAS
jgi:excisionase family DNA binding protein